MTLHFLHSAPAVLERFVPRLLPLRCLFMHQTLVRLHPPNQLISILSLLTWSLVSLKQDVWW